MENLNQSIIELDTQIKGALAKINFKQLSSELNDINKQTQDKDFWSDSSNPQEVMKQQANLQNRLKPWQSIYSDIKDLVELSIENDKSLDADLQKQYTQLAQEFESLKKELRFSGEYDDRDVLLSIYAGAGGTDAQDWAAMLLRMYLRWAKNNKLTVTNIDESVGEEAGIKSATIEIDGAFMYGKLKGESGVHRLVRLSPFNSDNLRQTSFAKVEILPKIIKKEQLEIDEKDFKIDVYRAGGHGGQSVNTTDSAVRITHIPTGITASIQNERSQLQNKETAMTIIKSKLAQLQLEQHAKKLSDIKGPNQSAQWGNQIRSYVLHPYNMVKDLRTKHETSNTQGVLDGDLEGFINSYLEQA